MIKQNWIDSSFEVMKYDPIYRNQEGHYLKEEWTGLSDIGEFIGGHILKEEEYLETENKYVAAVEYLFHFYSCTKVRLRSKRLFDPDEPRWLGNEKLEIIYQSLKKRRVVDFEELDSITRLILRGTLIVDLICKNNDDIAVRFGYDLYMNFNCLNEDQQVIKEHIENKIGLFTHR